MVTFASRAEALEVERLIKEMPPSSGRIGPFAFTIQCRMGRGKQARKPFLLSYSVRLKR